MSKDASRLEWTGERYLPGRGGIQIALEHEHRYQFAARLVRGLTVLDAASGEGYGSHVLAEGAESVTGVEIDAATVDHARARYTGIEFRVGDVESLPFPDASFEAIVSFETIEHVDAPGRAIAEFRRLLRPGGRLVLSTPNAPGAPDAATSVNPYHRTDFDEASLRQLLEEFEIEAIVPQRIVGMSVLGVPDPASINLARREGDTGEPRFLVAVARVRAPGRDTDVEPPLVSSGLFEPAGRLVVEYSRWLEDAQAVVREKVELVRALTAMNEDLGRRYEELEDIARRQRREFLEIEGKARTWLAELEFLRGSNQRLTEDYDELRHAHRATLTALATASAALRATGGRREAE